MNCKNCGVELEENQTICPACGENMEAVPVEEVREKPKKQKKPMKKATKLILSITAGVLALAVVVGVLVLALRKNDVYYKSSYTTWDFLAGLSRDKVVATMGDYKLTNGQLQVFYWMQVYEFIDYYGDYSNEIGLDLKKPLNKQIYNKTTGMTWEQYFLDEALSAWNRCLALAHESKSSAYQLPEDFDKYFAELESNLQKNADSGKYASIDSMLQEQLGPNITFEDYYYYMQIYYASNLYFGYLTDQIKPTDAELEAYFKENEAALKAQNPSVTKDSGKMVDVRHILLMPKGGYKDATNQMVYSDAEWEECRVRAQAVYDEWLAGEKTEESFGALANSKSEDRNGNVTNGGLYPDVYKGQMVKAFEEWCFDASRKTGDHGLVKTEYGYHIMYYIDGEEAWIRHSRQGVVYQKSSELLQSYDGKIPMDVQYSSIVISSPDFNN